MSHVGKPWESYVAKLLAEAPPLTDRQLEVIRNALARSPRSSERDDRAMTTQTYSWTAVTSRGVGQHGRTEIADLEVWTRRKFDSRTRALDVYDDDGNYVAAIGRNVDGIRTWWAER